MSKVLKLAVAEPSAIIRCGLLALLRGLPGRNPDIRETGGMARLSALLARPRPDVLGVTPASLGLCTPRQLREQSGCEGLKCVALPLAMTDSSVLNAYDETFSLYDSEEQLRAKMLRLGEGRGAQERQEPLSAREREIVVCIVKGMTNKQIADHLCISAHTVITHRRNIVSKLQIHSSAGLTIYAIVNKLVELSDVKDSIGDI